MATLPFDLSQLNLSNFLDNPSFDLQEHFDNTQLLKNAVASGDITNEEYNLLSGYDTTQTMPAIFNIPGTKMLNQGLGSLGYNLIQSMFGNQPFSEIPGDVYRNIKGVRKLPPNLLNKYNQIMYQGLQTAGQEALGQTQPQIQAQQAASQATQQGNYQAPTMTSQQIVQEAKDTGGTVNPFEVTQAAQNERPRPRPRPRPHHSLAKGGIVSINDLIRRM
jgi:hypothetical protein